MEGADIEKPKIEEREIPQMNHRGTVSIKEKLAEYKNKENLEKEVAQEKYDFIEDVPNFEKKLNLYNFEKYIQQRINEKKFFWHFRAEDAMIDARDIKEKFGEGKATYFQDTESIKDFFGHPKYKVDLNRPEKSEYSDILDENGNLLPSKRSIQEFKETAKPEVEEDKFDSLQKAS